MSSCLQYLDTFQNQMASIWSAQNFCLHHQWLEQKQNLLVAFLIRLFSSFHVTKVTKTNRLQLCILLSRLFIGSEKTLDTEKQLGM